MDASAVLAYLRATGHRVTDVDVVNQDDPSTWVLTVPPNVTREERTAAETSMRAFDPSAPAVKETEATVAAAALLESWQFKVLWLWLFRELHAGKDPTPAERDAATAGLLQAAKDTPR